MTINNNYSWVSFNLPGLRPCPGTYHRYLDVPPIAFPKECSLEDIESPTACYSLKNSDYYTETEVEGIKLTPYFSDQQACVVWYLGSDGQVYYTHDEVNFHICAYSRAEFDSRIVIESSLWFKLIDVVGYSEINPDKVAAIKNTLNSDESLYVDYYLSKTKEELETLPKWE